MGVEKLGYGVGKLLASPTGREMLTGAIITAAPVVAPIAVGAAIGTGITAGVFWLIDKFEDNK